MPDVIYTCTTCDGATTVDEYVCPDCLGSGALPIIGRDVVFKTFLVKLNSIIDEQASAREDLTAALTQIWNKVKDL